MNKQSYLLVRFAVAVSMFCHGLVRLPKLREFSSGMVIEFKGSLLPGAIVEAFAYVLPFIELGTGFLLLIGLFTRQALLAGGVTMILLIFGSGLIEQWNALPSQMIHLAFFAVLLHYLPDNSFALDTRRKNVF